MCYARIKVLKKRVVHKFDFYKYQLLPIETCVNHLINYVGGQHRDKLIPMEDRTVYYNIILLESYISLQTIIITIIYLHKILYRTRVPEFLEAWKINIFKKVS